MTEPTKDDELGMAWWNSLTERERKRWSFLAGDTGRAKEAWETYKAVQRDAQSNGEQE